MSHETIGYPWAPSTQIRSCSGRVFFLVESSNEFICKKFNWDYKKPIINAMELNLNLVENDKDLMDLERQMVFKYTLNAH